ncbi:MAG: histidinol-phosphate aminotransferase family protein [Aeropyrum sp.]|nr:histidinol-phosphate aminotransferase family protein [Aeropyrum sp.]
MGGPQEGGGGVQERVHGGRPPPGVEDFSNPLSPLGPPRELEAALKEASTEAAHRKYPDYSYKGLREALASYYDIDAEAVVPLAGAAESLTLALAAFRPDALVTVEPTFGDHRVQAAGAGVSWATAHYIQEGRRFLLDPGLVCSLVNRIRGRTLVVVSNPNNPTGSLAPASVIWEIASCLDEGSVLLVDEAFIDFTSSPGVLRNPPPQTIVVRSLTKILATPGLRVGFAYSADKNLSRRLDMVRQPWNVGGLAALAIEKLISRSSKEFRRHVESSRSLVTKLREAAVTALRAAGLEVFDSKAPYLLVWHRLRHPSMQRCLEARGYYVRDASSFPYLTPNYSRVSVRRGVEGLASAFADALQARGRC